MTDYRHFNDRSAFRSGDGDNTEGGTGPADQLKGLIRAQEKEIKGLREEVATLKASMTGSDEAEAQKEKVCHNAFSGRPLDPDELLPAKWEAEMRQKEHEYQNKISAMQKQVRG